MVQHFLSDFIDSKRFLVLKKICPVYWSGLHKLTTGICFEQESLPEVPSVAANEDLHLPDIPKHDLVATGNFFLLQLIPFPLGYLSSQKIP